MSREEIYRHKAAELRRRAREPNVSERFEGELLALAYDRLADHAHRIAEREQQQQQQQQQAQPPKKQQ